jgi:hypothetical protein
MSQAPVPYERQSDFVSDATNNPEITVAQIATGLDSEFFAVKDSLNTAISRLGEIQRDDGALENNVVSVASLGADALGIFQAGNADFKGNWSSNTAYTFGQSVVSSGSVYICIVSHTSSLLFGDDVLASKWTVVGSTVAMDASALLPMTRWSFTGTGSQVAFTITGASLNSSTAYLVTVDGVLQDPVSYSISGATLTFTEAPPSGCAIVVVCIGYAKPSQQQITTIEIAESAVTTTKIADSAITTAKLAAASVTADKLENGSVGQFKIADGAVTFTKLASGVAIANLGYTPVAPTDARLSDMRTPSDSSVETVKIVNNAVTTAKINDGAITTAKLADTSVTNAKMASNAVLVGNLGTTEQKRIAKAWVNFNGATVAGDYATGNTITYVTGVGSNTTVTITRTAHAVNVGDWITVSGVTGATGVNGNYQVTSTTATTIVYSVTGTVTGTVAGTAVVRIATIRASHNVSSIAKNGVGDYTVNFSNALTDANYAVAGLGGGTTANTVMRVYDDQTARSVNGFRVLQFVSSTATTAAADSVQVSLVVFGNA